MFGLNMGQFMQNQMGGPVKDPTDSSETVIISTVALIKMFKHASRGVPIEVMGLCIGRFVDRYTVYVQDVFTMPQKGASDNVEAIDDAYQVEMINMLEQVGIKEKVVGWFHSHPGYRCWLSGIDQKMQESFEKDNQRCVAIVVDPINSANGRLVIESFRLCPGATPGMLLGGGKPIETRIVTGDAGFIRKRDPVSVQHGMGSAFYQMAIQFNKLGFEQLMITKIQSKLWIDFVGGAKQQGDMSRLLERVKDRDFIGCDEEAQRIIDDALQDDLDQCGAVEAPDAVLRQLCKALFLVRVPVYWAADNALLFWSSKSQMNAIIKTLSFHAAAAKRGAHDAEMRTALAMQIAYQNGFQFRRSRILTSKNHPVELQINPLSNLIVYHLDGSQTSVDSDESTVPDELDKQIEERNIPASAESSLDCIALMMPQFQSPDELQEQLKRTGCMTGIGDLQAPKTDSTEKKRPPPTPQANKTVVQTPATSTSPPLGIQSPISIDERAQAAQIQDISETHIPRTLLDDLFGPRPKSLLQKQQTSSNRVTFHETVGIMGTEDAIPLNFVQQSIRFIVREAGISSYGRDHCENVLKAFIRGLAD